MLASWALGAAGLVVVTGCAGSSQPKVDHTLRPIATCPATAVIPPDVSSVVPAADSPPTSELRVGQAVVFAAPPGSTISSVGVVDAPSGPVVCQSARGAGASRQAVILGLAPGFVQVGVVVPGSTAVSRTLVTVTG